MPAPRKPKKVLVQFAVALVVAVILGGVALVAGFSIINNVSSQAKNAQNELKKEKELLEAEKQRLQEEQENLLNKPKTYRIVEAAVDIAPGQPITPDMVTLVSTEERPPAGILSMLSQAVGSSVKSEVMQGEPLELSKLLPKDNLNVKEGMRAITIQVDTIGGLNGALIPGAHVDILTTVQNQTGFITRTLLQNILVVSMGDPPSSGESLAPKQQSANSSSAIPVTVMVNPREAEMLTLANKLGAFHLTLRNYNDSHVDKMTGADLTKLMTGIEAGSIHKGSMPNKPQTPHVGSDGLHNVNFSPEAGNLPAPGGMSRGNSKFSMQIYRGTGTETLEFQQ